jgi:hypothetical protein
MDIIEVVFTASERFWLIIAGWCMIGTSICSAILFVKQLKRQRGPKGN